MAKKAAKKKAAKKKAAKKKAASYVPLPLDEFFSEAEMVFSRLDRSYREGRKQEEAGAVHDWSDVEGLAQKLLEDRTAPPHIRGLTLNLLADICQRTRRLEDALARLVEALGIWRRQFSTGDLDPGDLVLFERRAGNLALQLGREDEASAHFAAAEEVVPGSEG